MAVGTSFIWVNPSAASQSRAAPGASPGQASSQGLVRRRDQHLLAKCAFELVAVFVVSTGLPFGNDVGTSLKVGDKSNVTPCCLLDRDVLRLTWLRHWLRADGHPALPPADKLNSTVPDCRATTTTMRARCRRVRRSPGVVPHRGAASGVLDDLAGGLGCPPTRSRHAGLLAAAAGSHGAPSPHPDDFERGANAASDWQVFPSRQMRRRLPCRA